MVELGADSGRCRVSSARGYKAGSWQLAADLTMDRTNDFAFKIATPNGTGSASANGLLMQAIFRMGVPVTGKNVFPSNIQGLPTWYEIRVSRHGYTARTPTFDLMVALNPATYQKDVAEVRSGGWLLYDSTWPLDTRLTRPDVTYIGIPLQRAVQLALSRRARADPDEEHRVRRRAGGSARHRRRRASRDAQGEVRQEAGARRLESGGAGPRARLRHDALRLPAAHPPRADGRDEGRDPDRRQHRGGARLPLCRAPRSAPGIPSRRRPR